MEVGIEAARWVVGKALGPAAGGVLEAWAASSHLGTNIRDLRMEPLYAQGMLNNARGRGREDIRNPALEELLQELRDLAYNADDSLDEVDYFRIQDELDGTYRAADEHAGGCLRNHALNARHTARTSFEHGSSAPMVVPLDWVAGVPDGRPAPARRTRPDVCRAPPAPRAPRDEDRDDDFREPPRRRDVPRSTRVRELFPDCSSERSVRVRTRSPPAYRRADAPEYTLLDRGRQACRSPVRSARGWDILQHAAEERERHRSRSPVPRSRAASRDPLLDIVRCSGGSGAVRTFRFSTEDDPMVREYGCSLTGCPRAAAPLNFSPDNADDVHRSPEYRPVSDLWRPAQSDEIVFGPGVQLDGPAMRADEMADISDRVTRMDIDGAPPQSGPGLEPVQAGEPGTMSAAALEDKEVQALEPLTGKVDRVEYVMEPVAGDGNDDDAYASFTSSMFRVAPAPILERPDLPAPSCSRSRKKIVVAPSRSSTRLVARSSAILVAERAQQKLMRELAFVDSGKATATDAAVTAYIDLYGRDLPDDAVKVLRAVTRLGNKELSRALEAIAAEVGAAGLDGLDAY